MSHHRLVHFLQSAGKSDGNSVFISYGLDGLMFLLPLAVQIRRGL